MKHVMITLLFSAVLLSAQAVPSYTPATQNQPLTEDNQSGSMVSGSSYSGTIYTPFDNSTPSQYTEESFSPSSPRPASGPRRDKVGGPDSGQSNESPIGEPWVMVLFATLFGAVVALRKRKA